MQCTLCSNTEVIYKREYSGEYLCKECFSNSIVTKVAKTISKYSMIKYGDKVAIGVSGGKDSLTLLYILALLSKKHNNKLIAITVDEGIDNYREESLRIVNDFTSMLNIEHHIFSSKSICIYYWFWMHESYSIYITSKDIHKERLDKIV